MKSVQTLLNNQPETSPPYLWPSQGQPLDKDFDDLLLLAAQIGDTPIAAITTNSNGQTFIKAAFGIECRDIAWAPPGDLPTSSHLLVIRDAQLDPYFSQHPLTTGDLHIRFYACVPLITHDGTALGHLMLMDSKPGELKGTQVAALQTLAKHIVSLLAMKLPTRKTEEADRIGSGDNSDHSGDKLMEAIFHDAIDAVIVLDGRGMIIKWNPKAEDIFGWMGAEVIGDLFYETVLPVTPTTSNERTNQLSLLLEKKMTDVADNTASNSLDISLYRKDLSEVDISLSISAANINGRRLFILFATDITEHKLAAEKLDLQQAFYENILNKLPTDVAVFDAEHKYLFVNPAAISKEEYRRFIVGKDDYEYAAYRNRDQAVADSRRAMFLEVKNTGKEIRWEDSLPDPNGNVITHLRRMHPVYDEKGALSLVIGFGIDITDRKNMEIKQAELVKQLYTQNTQLIDFCSIVSHNLRAPLVNMSMLVDFIEGSDEEDERQLLTSKLRPVIDSLYATFNELVESIQIKHDLEVKSENVCLNDCVKRTMDGLQTEITQLGAHINVDFNEISVLNCPPQYLNSIIHNLVSNSLKYHYPGRPPEIVLRTKKVNDKVILSVSDNGLGVDLVKHRENFFKIGKVFHRHPNAKGFGLFMTRTQVEAMGGKIWVESVPDQGTSFFIEFTNQKRKAS